LALLLKEALEAGSIGAQAQWNIFDRTLATTFTNDPELRKHIDELFSERYNDLVQEFVSELFAKRKPQDLVLLDLSKISRKVALMGNTIFIGYGARMSTRGISGGLHIHLEAPEAQRVSRIQQQRGINTAEAIKFVRDKDSSYERMMKEHFHVNIHDPLAFDIVFNTGALELKTIAKSIISLISTETGETR
jgi:cytidylate kinase